MSLRLVTAAAVFLLYAPALSAQADPDRPVAGGGTIPAGWHVRTEPNRQTGQPASLENVKFATMGDGLHTTVGPAAIYWRDRDTISGTYHVVATSNYDNSKKATATVTVQAGNANVIIK